MLNRNLVTAALLLVAPAFAGIPQAYAGGATEHLRVAAKATQFVTDPDLRQLLQNQQHAHYGMGALFADTPFKEGLDRHSDTFLNTYIKLIKNRSGSNLLGNKESRELIAHFMGCVTHVIQDSRFDRYFLTRVDAICEFNDGGDPCPSTSQKPYGCSQWFTDFWLDGAVSDRKLGIRPDEPAVPGPYLGSSKYAFSCFNDPKCLDMREVLKKAFPKKTEKLIWPEITARVAGHFAVVAGQPASASKNRQVVKGRCNWALENLQSNYGGINDAGRAVAAYINKTWNILKQGGRPRFEESELWSFPNETISVYQHMGDRSRYDFASWIKTAQGVSRFQLVGKGETARIGFLVDGELRVLEGPFDRNTSPVVVAENVTSFHLNGDRIGVVAGTGPGREGHVLMVKQGSLSAPWITIDDGVLAVQLEGDRVAYEKQLGKRSPVSKLMLVEGELDEKPVLLAAGKIKQFQLHHGRIGLLRDKSSVPGSPPIPQELLITSEDQTSKWESLIEDYDLRNFQIEGDRIGVQRAEELLVKTGGGDSEWVSEASNVSQWQLDGQLTGVVSDGELLVRRETGGWRSQGADVVDFDMQDARGILKGVLSVDDANVLRMHRGSISGLEGVPVMDIVTGLQIEQYRIGVLLGDALYVKEKTGAVSVSDQDGTPLREVEWSGSDRSGSLLLSPPFPNPANRMSEIHFTLSETEAVKLSIFDVRGALVRVLLPHQQMQPGQKIVPWDLKDDAGTRVNSGVYFVGLRVGSTWESRRIVVGLD